MGCGASALQAIGLSKQVDPPTVIIDEEFEEGVQDETIPSNWTIKKHVDVSLFSQMVYADQSHHKVFDSLLKETHQAISTKDRPCPNREAPCERTSMGCPCVRVGGDPGLPTAYIVRRIVRVEHSQMWGRYAEKRKEITALRKDDKIIRFHPAIATGNITTQNKDVFGPVNGSINEVYLWHGTHVRTALSIAQKDFNMDLAGTGRGSMYGAGAYFAESSTKADEYGFDEPGGYYDGIRAMLLCRVTMGKMYYTSKFGEETAVDNVKSGTHDSVLGDLAKHRKTFREFVVFNADQVYPEYVVLYQRVHKADNWGRIKEIASTPYHLELPVYWRNCHRVPNDDEFDEQCRLRRTTCDLLQQLVNACCEPNGPEVVLIAARRIENTRLLNKYSGFKASVRKLLQGNVAVPALSPSGKCKPLTELPGVDQVTTTKFLKEQGAFTEESICVDNLESPLNEHLLWYGASQDEIRSMSHHGLDVTRASNNPEFSRFGAGLYLAEKLDRCLSFAEPDENGVKHVLLCRVCCGEMFYTQEEALPDGDKRARMNGKHSLLANPGKKGDREYIVFENAQVYPEFVLELGEKVQADS